MIEKIYNIQEILWLTVMGHSVLKPTMSFPSFNLGTNVQRLFVCLFVFESYLDF